MALHPVRERRRPPSREIFRSDSIRSCRSRRKRGFFLEELEQRTLLTVTLTGVPTWIAEGPAPNTGNGNEENIPAETGGAPNAVSGGLEAMAVDPGNSNEVFVGGVNGGVWKTTNINANPVAWTPMTDQFPSLEISSLQFDPTDSTDQTVVAGFGNTSNIRTNLGPLTGLLKTTDGGTTWTDLGNTSVTGVTRRERFRRASAGVTLSWWAW